MLISVLIDTYNHEHFLREALDSVLSQEGVDNQEIEIIVVDDGSTDSTPALVKSYGERVKYVRKINGGQGSAFNVGIRICKGDLIAFLDGDDWWHLQKLNVVLGVFAHDPDLVAVGHGIFEVDQVAGHTYEVKSQCLLDFQLTSMKQATRFINNKAYLGTSRLTARRDTLLSLLNVPEDLVFEADEYLFTLLPACGKVVVLPECLTYYRIHGGNLYHASRTVRQATVIDDRLRMRAKIYTCLQNTLPTALLERGCSKVIIDVVITPVDVTATRLRFQTDGGGRWKNFHSEIRAARLEKPHRSLVDSLVLVITLFLTIVFPPKIYFAIRASYTGSVFHRILRGTMGDGSK